MTSQGPGLVGVAPARRPRPQLAVVTWSIIALCVAVWAAESLMPGFLEQVVLSPELGRHEPWRFLTAAFAHTRNPLHIAVNMLALYSVGRPLEFALGRLRYIALYLVSALGGSIGFVLMALPPSPAHPDGLNWFTGLLGASGAVFGLFGALLVLVRTVGGSMRQMLVLLAVNAVLGLTVPGIAWQAHLGGFLTGLLLGWLLVRDRAGVARGRASLWWLGTGVLTVVLAALAMLRYGML